MMDTWIFWMGAHWGPFPSPVSTLSLFFCPFYGHHFGSMLGPGREPKIDPKRDLWRKMRSPERVFYQFFSFSCSFRLFHGFLSQKGNKTQWKNERVCWSCARFFWNGQKPNSMHRRSVLSSFYFFMFFLSTNCKNLRKKSMKKVKPEKWPKMTTRGVPE